MREALARIVALVALVGLFGLAVAFAVRQNPTGLRTRPPAPDATGVVADSLRGRAVFENLGCVRCHSVAGRGGPRAPLDGVGARRSPGSLRAWTLGVDDAAPELAPSVRIAKAANRDAPAAELDALVRYLATLTTPR